MKALLVILMGFAWAIGGEKYFGRWRRGILVAAVSMAILGTPWWGLLILAGMFYIYQALFYDMGIRMIWPGSGDKPNPILGWLILFCNGLICGAYPMAIWHLQGKWIHGVMAWLISGIGFCFISWLSNGLKLKLPFCIRLGEVKILCPEDTWWLACFIYGLILGALSI